MYVKVNNGTATKYSLSQLKKDNPNVSFPTSPSDALLSSYDVYPLVNNDRPAVDIVETGPIQEINGVWTQTYTGRNFTAEEKRQRMKVTMRQARLALLQQNLLSQVESAIAGMQEPEKSQVSIEWEYASTVERTSPWMSTMGAALGLTDEQLDQLFETASTL